MIQFYFGFYGWQFTVIATIVLNWYRIDIRGLKPHYLSANYSRAFFGFVCLILMSAQDGSNGIDLAYPRTFIPYIPHMVYILSSFYLFFDAGLNGLRGKRWNYRGKSSGWFDRMKIVFYYTLKAICLAGLIVSIIVIWQNLK